MNLFEYLVLIFITILPTILLWLYINKLDKIKEPKKVLVKLFTAGVLSAFVTLLLTLIVCFIFPWYGFIIPPGCQMEKDTYVKSMSNVSLDKDIRSQ